MHMLSSMDVTVNTKEVLDTLKRNLAKHSKIVKEARAGYVEVAQKKLNERLQDLKKGKIVSLHFSLQVPVDQTKVYETAIKMLEIHQEPTLHLNAQQVRNLVMDEWDWTQQFYGTNALYSGTAAEFVGSANVPEEF